MKCTLKSGKATDKRKKFVLKFIIAFVFASSFSGILGSGPGAIKSSAPKIGRASCRERV